jgi:hypothetical protein
MSIFDVIGNHYLNQDWNNYRKDVSKNIGQHTASGKYG